MEGEAFREGNTRFAKCPELWYVVGAVLGDGYLFKSGTSFLVGLDVRSQEFATEFASKISRVLSRPITAHLYARRGIWFIRVRNRKLFSLIEKLRERPEAIKALVSKGSSKRNATEFLSGLFDAEGCLKVVKEAARHTPKL